MLIDLKGVGVCYHRKKSISQASKTNVIRERLFWALKDITFSLNQGEILGVLGKNGAGKSTLLTLLAGIIAPSQGTMVSTKKTCLLSLQAGFEPFLNGKKNIIISGLLLGLTYEQVKSKILEIIEFSELGEFIDEPIATYSAGMKARLGFSIALHLSPDVILIDEVLGVGDQEFQDKSSKALKNKLKGDMAAVIVSHSKETIMELCHKCIVIDKGVSVFQGKVTEALAFYDELYAVKPIKLAQ